MVIALRYLYFYIIGVLILTQSSIALDQNPFILTLSKDHQKILSTKTQNIDFEKDQELVKNISDKLLQTLILLKSRGKSTAGLAAPQIGEPYSIFLYSYDRTIENMETVINPTWAMNSIDVTYGWEACFSAMEENGPYTIAKLPRFESIKASYYNFEGKLIEKILQGFAGKVFQHEHDHLQGVCNIHKEGAETLSFPTQEAFEIFMKDIRAQDATRYHQPERKT